MKVFLYILPVLYSISCEKITPYSQAIYRQKYASPSRISRLPEPHRYYGVPKEPTTRSPSEPHREYGVPEKPTGGHLPPRQQDTIHYQQYKIQELNHQSNKLAPIRNYYGVPHKDIEVAAGSPVPEIPPAKISRQPNKVSINLNQFAGFNRPAPQQDKINKNYNLIGNNEGQRQYGQQKPDNKGIETFDSQELPKTSPANFKQYSSRFNSISTTQSLPAHHSVNFNKSPYYNSNELNLQNLPRNIAANFRQYPSELQDVRNYQTVTKEALDFYRRIQSIPVSHSYTTIKYQKPSTQTQNLNFPTRQTLVHVASLEEELTSNSPGTRDSKRYYNQGDRDKDISDVINNNYYHQTKQPLLPPRPEEPVNAYLPPATITTSTNKPSTPRPTIKRRKPSTTEAPSPIDNDEDEDSDNANSEGFPNVSIANSFSGGNASIATAFAGRNLFLVQPDGSFQRLIFSNNPQNLQDVNLSHKTPYDLRTIIPNNDLNNHPLLYSLGNPYIAV